MSTLEMSGAITARSTRTVKWSIEAASGPLRNREVVYGPVFDAGGHGGRRPLDLDDEKLQELGHEVIVANARELCAIPHSDRKSDQVDAEKLARYARLESEHPPADLPPHHRTAGSPHPDPCTGAAGPDAHSRRERGPRPDQAYGPSFRHPPRGASLNGVSRSSAGSSGGAWPGARADRESQAKIKHYDRQIQQLTQTPHIQRPRLC